MKFPRTAKTLGSQSDAAPYAAVFFLLVIFLLLGALIPTPGVPLSLPLADDLPGTSKSTIAVAVDTNNRYYFDNQLVTEAKLSNSLSNAVSRSAAPLTLVIQADKAVNYGQLLHLTLLARSAGITNALLATLPNVSTAKP
ncbi:MAG TPA: biopolymer transporter ExbD [Verrucomicrobiae bacterium]|jgi:biopolymer transport protein ExbD